MSRMLLFSDLHLRAESMSVVREVFTQLLKEAHKNGAGTIGFLGDFYHLRYAVPVEVQNMVATWLEEIHGSGLQIILLPGNHDQVDEMGTNALEVFDGWPHVTVHTEPCLDEWGAWLPYRKPSFVPQILDDLRKARSTPQPLFAHLGVSGAMMNNLKADNHGISSGQFEGFERVMLGHYHKQQDLGGGLIHYIGSPYQTRADEWGQAKGFALWDAQERTFTRLQQDIGPKYHRLKLEDLGEAQDVPWGPQDRVKLMVPEVTDELKAWVQSTPGHVILEDQSDKVVQTRFAFKQGTSLIEFVQKYMLDNQPKNLDQNVLWMQWEELQ